MSTSPGARRAPRRCCTASSASRRRSARKTSGRSGVASSRSQSPLSATEIIERLRAQFGDDVVRAEEVHGHPVITVAPGRYHEMAVFLRDEPDLGFDFFDFLSGVDYTPKGRGL